METVRKCDDRSERGPPLLRLPAELLSEIIEIHLLGIRSPPSLSNDFIQSRVPLANAWDPTRPTETNIYVEHDRSSNFACTLDLRLVNKTLKALVDRVAELVRKVSWQRRWVVDDKGNFTYQMQSSHTLDLMVVKDIGLFPTWLTSPPNSITLDGRCLRVNIRTVRPDSVKFPEAWVAAGQHKATEGDLDSAMRSRWSLLTVLYLFGAGRLSWAADAAVVNRAGIVTRAAAAAKASQPRCFHATLLPKRRHYFDHVDFNFIEQEYDASREQTKSLGTGHGFLVRPPPPGHTPFARALLRAPQLNMEGREGPGDDEAGAASLALRANFLETLGDMHCVHRYYHPMLPPHKDPLIDSVVEGYSWTSAGHCGKSRDAIPIHFFEDSAPVIYRGVWQPDVKYDDDETSVFRCCGRAVEGNTETRTREENRREGDENRQERDENQQRGDEKSV